MVVHESFARVLSHACQQCIVKQGYSNRSGQVFAISRARDARGQRNMREGLLSIRFWILDGIPTPTRTCSNAWPAVASCFSAQRPRPRNVLGRWLSSSQSITAQLLPSRRLEALLAWADLGPSAMDLFEVPDVPGRVVRIEFAQKRTALDVSRVRRHLNVVPS